MRAISIAVCMLCVSLVSHAQKKASDWTNLNTLHAGDKIQVRELNKKKVSGTFVESSNTAISLQTGGSPQSIQKQDVQTVTLMKNKHRLRNALILGGVGAGVGAGIGAAQHHSCPSTETFCFDIGGRSFPAIIGGVIGLLGGAAAGAFLPSHETVYALNPH